MRPTAAPVIHLLLLCATQAFASDAPAPVTVSVLRSNEAVDRVVDQAALDSQRKAARSIIALLKKYRGKYQEPLMLMRLVDSYQQSAAIQFRVAHGKAQRSGGKPDLAEYNATLKALVSNLTDIMTRFPSHEEMSRVVYLRGNARQELGEKALAIKDYHDLIERFDGTPDAIRGCMALADIAITDNQHEKAIGYLKRVEKHPEDNHYPFALYKMGWSYYNLKDIPQALRYVERTVAYYDERKSETNAALRENALLDSTVFYLDAYEGKIASYGIDKALDYFRGLERGPVLGRMLVRFAKLLRSHGHDADLINWKDQVLASESKRPEAFDVLIVAFEHQLNRQRYPDLLKSSRDMVLLSKNGISKESMVKGQKLLLDTAEGMQAVIVKNKHASEHEEIISLSRVLAGVYDSFIQLAGDEDPRALRAHYNLAETLFKIRQFEDATAHYRWVVVRGSKDATVKDASLKAISSRYEHLMLQKLIPGTLVAKAMPEEDAKLSDGLMREWLGWVDEHISQHGTVAENFYFEANRSLYAAGAIRAASERMADFSLKHSASKFAVPSATLAVDTYVASSDWESLHELISKLERVKEWRGGEFAKKLHALDVGALYKIAEATLKKGDSRKALRLAESFLKSESNDDFIALAAKAARAEQELGKAESYYGRLIQRDPHSVLGVSALLSRAQLNEERFSYAAAAADYKGWLELPATATKMDAKEREKMRSRALMLAWIGGKTDQIQTFLKSKTLCGDGNAAECDRYEALAWLQGQQRAPSAAEAERALSRAGKGFDENRALWAAVALEGAAQLSFRDRNKALKILSKGMDDLEPLVKSSVLASFTRTIPELLRLNRKSLTTLAPLSASERHITHRVDMIREFENAATLAAKMPYAGLQAVVLNEVAWVYVDFAQGLRGLAPPKGMSEKEMEEYRQTLDKIIIPFEEKSADMRGKAFELATKSEIDDATRDAITEVFFQENPSQAKALKANRSLAAKRVAFDISLLRLADTQGPWFLAADMSCDDAGVKCMKARWWKAIESRSWPQAVYLSQKVDEFKDMPEDFVKLMRAMTMARLGAQAEGIAELGDIKRIATGG